MARHRPTTSLFTASDHVYILHLCKVKLPASEQSVIQNSRPPSFMLRGQMLTHFHNSFNGACRCKFAIKAAITIAIRLRFDSSKWASWQYVSEVMNSYQTTFYFGSVWFVKGLYQRRQSKDATRCWSVSVNAILITVTYTSLFTSLYRVGQKK